jgi:hypothetical protein
MTIWNNTMTTLITTERISFLLNKATPLLRYQVIQKYLHAYSMNEIVKEIPLSKGTVNNIIHHWKASINGIDVDDIRIFLAEFRKSNMSIQESVQGYRVANILEKLQVHDEFDEWMEDDRLMPYRRIPKKNIGPEQDEEDTKDDGSQNIHSFDKRMKSKNLLEEIRSSIHNAEDDSASHFINKFEENKISDSRGYQITWFINDIYKSCKNHGIKPTLIIEWIQDLFHFYSVLSKQSSEQTVNFRNYQNQISNEQNEDKSLKEEILDDKINNEIPLISRVSFFIEQKKKEIDQLANVRSTVIEEIKSIIEKKEKVQSQLSNTIKEDKKAFSYLQWYSNLKQELLDKFNFVIEEEFEAFVKAINDFKEYGFNTSLLIREYKDFDSLRQQMNLTREEIHLNQGVIQDLLKEISNLRGQCYNYEQAISNYQELKLMGFGLKELKQLKGLITEMSVANSIDPSEAVNIFFKELEKNYDSKLGLESKIKGMQDEYELLKNKVAENQRYLAMQNPVAPNLTYLYSQGLTNDDIKGFTDLVISLSNSYLLDYKSIKKDNTVYASTYNNSNSNDIIDKKEFWKLIVQKFKDLNIINSQIERLRYHRKLEEMKQPYDQDDDLAS